jgi:RimJ/RimL family protein N-acetyltransferase
MFEGGHRLRALEPADAAQLYGWENRPEDWWVGARLAPIAHEALLRYATTDTDPFAEGSVRLVLEAPDGTAVGAVDLYAIDARSGKAGVGILVDARRRGEGHGAAGLRLLTDYAAGSFQLFLTAFYAAVVVTQTARGDDMFFQMLNGATAQIQDTHALERLKGRC